ncbi:hypothetical protein Pelo_12551 [Pelomyxa schiedti]|nr:hypothetical protein Pelo_12551 [Pelomyxa schiedti]
MSVDLVKKQLARRDMPIVQRERRLNTLERITALMQARTPVADNNTEINKLILRQTLCPVEDSASSKRGNALKPSSNKKKQSLPSPSKPLSLPLQPLGLGVSPTGLSPATKQQTLPHGNKNKFHTPRPKSIPNKRKPKVSLNGKNKLAKKPRKLQRSHNKAVKKIIHH